MQSWAHLTSRLHVLKPTCVQAVALRAHLTAVSGRGATREAIAEDTQKTISSTGNSFVKHCVKLRTSSKYRVEAGAILLVGSDLLQEAAGAANACLHVRTLILGEGRPHIKQLVAQRTVVATEAVMRKLTGLESAAGVDAAAEIDLPWPADFLHDWPHSSSNSSSSSSTSRASKQADASRMTESSIQLLSDSRVPSSDMESGLGRGGSDGEPSTQGSYLHHKGSSQPSSSQSSLQGRVLHGAGHGRRHRLLRRLLALDGVQDPGNLGTLLRSALAFGWDGVFLLQGCCSPFNDKAIKSSRGAVLRVAIGSGSLAELLQIAHHHKLRLIAADPEFPTEGPKHKQSTSKEADASQGVCLVLGSEGQGLSQEASAACVPVAIPMAGSMESLNVGIAGGILMWALSEGGASKLLSRLDSLNLLPQAEQK